MAKLLVVDDDIELATAVKSYLEMQGYTVELAHNGADALQLMSHFEYDLVVLDWNMPEMPGDAVCRQYRHNGGQAPLIFLTGRNEVAALEQGLASGADDYMTKPFEVRELAARVRARLRRGVGNYAAELRIGQLLLKPETHILMIDQTEVKLRPKETALLEFLMRNPNRIFSAQEILNRVWASDSESNTASVRTWMGLIRRKLEANGQANFVRTVLGSGYIVDDK